MSYILEALMQAQLERQRHGVPGLHTVQALPRRRPPPRRHWPLLVAGITGLSAVLAVAWLAPWRHDRAEVSAPIISAAGIAASEAPAQPTVVSMALPSLATTSAAPQMRLATPESGAAKADEPRRKHHRKGRNGKAPVKIAALPGMRIYSIAELPTELQKVARNISIAGFAHSDNPRERTAIINDRARREGEEVSGGLRVERIAGDGVVFNLKGYRFRKGRT